MKKNYTVLEQKFTTDGTIVALIDRHFSFCSYVVAWCFEPDKMEWGQGHYFDDLNEAKEYYDKNYKSWFTVAFH